jgi:PAS domain S-box-containing protein
MESRHKLYFEAMPGYLTVQDRSFRIIDANRRFREDFGDYEGRFCFQVYKQRADRCEVCPVARTFEDGERHESEERVHTRGGRDVAVLVNTQPVRDESGDIVAVLEVSTDVTHIKSLQRLLRRNEQRCRLLFEEAPCFISTQDADLNVIEANRAFQEAFGNSLGRKCYEAYKHRAEPCPICPVQQCFDDGGIHSQEEIVTSLDGRHMNVLVTAAPLRDRHGQISAVMELSADITAVRELEDRLTQLGLLIGSVSHGLKGLLNGLAGGMYLVDSGFERDDRERVRKGWATVNRNVARINSVVSDILYYAKDRVPCWDALDAADLLHEVTALFESRARELGVQLAAEAEPGAGQFEADAQAIRSLLANLIENALDACRLDHARSEHRVAVRLRGLPGHVTFEVADNGIGMDRETCEKAFTLFFSAKASGTGLGLFIADKIARAHGGTIDLESRPGEGTRFTVSLPRTRPQQPVSKDHPAATEVASHV